VYHKPLLVTRPVWRERILGARVSRDIRPTDDEPGPPGQASPVAPRRLSFRRRVPLLTSGPRLLTSDKSSACPSKTACTEGDTAMLRRAYQRDEDQEAALVHRGWSLCA